MAYNNKGNCSDPNPGYNWSDLSSINDSLIDTTLLPGEATINLKIKVFKADPSLIPMNLRFELVKTDLDNNLITDSDPYNNDRGLFVGAVINLVYLEYKNGESEAPTYSYSPGKRINLEAKRIDSGDICYTILVPLSDDKSKSNDTTFKFPSEKFLEPGGDIANIFNFIVKASEIPNGKVDSAINDLSFIVDNNIPEFSNEITKID